MTGQLSLLAEMEWLSAEAPQAATAATNGLNCTRKNAKVKEAEDISPPVICKPDQKSDFLASSQQLPAC